MQVLGAVLAASGTSAYGSVDADNVCPQGKPMTLW